MRTPLVFGAALLALATACASPGMRAPAEGPAAEIERLIGDARCTDDSQCRTAPMPDKACGGPSGWWAYSTQRTEAAALAPALERAATAQAKANEGRMSTCSVVPDPGARCAREGAAGRCVLKRGAGGAATR